MDLNREKLADALENAIRTVVPLEGVVKMSGGVAQMVVEAIRGPRWMSVEIGRPENGIHVLCRVEELCDYPDAHEYDVPDYYVCEGYRINEEWLIQEAPDMSKVKKVTHWMPLPKAPDATPTGRAGQCPAPTETATVSKNPRVIPLDEVLGTYGHGFLEMKYPPDERGEDPVDAIEECVWLNGEVLSRPAFGDYNHFPRKSIADGYGSVRGGMRIWDWIPTDEERKATTWEATP